MNNAEINQRLSDLPEWRFNSDQKTIEREFQFKSYLKNISFVNAVAWLANRANHHPDLEVSFSRCLVRLTTHDAGGVSQKDFDLAKEINSL